MNWSEYIQEFEAILRGENRKSPYDQEVYLEYVNLNSKRMKRWLKRGVVDKRLTELINMIDRPQKWILIVEPWCGDGANIVPFIYLISDLNPLIELDIQLRDEGSIIDQYLTNGGKAMPKLIVRDDQNRDLFTWGPRPNGCYQLVQKQKKQEISVKDKKREIQMWYNDNEGIEIQEELFELICQHVLKCNGLIGSDKQLKVNTKRD